MYAVIKTGGRQAKVQEGDVLQVERMRAAGDVTFESILISGDDGTVITDRDALAKMPVKGKVLGEIRGKKVDVFHYRNKSGYRKSAGHRQTYTTVEITEIPGAPKKKAAAKKADKPKAEKKPAAKKPAAKKADEPKAEKKPAAKKSTAKETTKGEDE
ncbi:MAG: 50S ribosomal protein L21 [Acidimicrobiia bacterium]|nr:50S ribosomal protein L21 [Acidimicrobiia bacterium]MBT8247310.1 50S ribosomal protein L21 [Acidimicrobiia bacterium]NNL13737.1 50S ribosomal protein L21 [Acidimicrobiia bacterium]NNL98129.1 50S ribosomal protein L21 [Acidimicrobiia bacterium]RZV43491.1 MAG: 50S ribosomal protein L21 [Acidimicrobiia bacterium]